MNRTTSRRGFIQTVTRGAFGGLVLADAAPASEAEGSDDGRVGMLLDETHVELECGECHAEGLGAAPSCDACHDEKPEQFPVPKKE